MDDVLETIRRPPHPWMARYAVYLVFLMVGATVGSLANDWISSIGRLAAVEASVKSIDARLARMEDLLAGRPPRTKGIE